MAKVMISFPDELLKELDHEAERQKTTRSGLLQRAARREIGLGVSDREELIDRMEALSKSWKGPTDVVGLLRDDRQRND